MYRVRLDLTEIRRTERRAKEELAKVVDVMKRELDVAAANERVQHAYQNRTGRLEKSTRARIERRNPPWVVLEMRMPYASYVIRRGLSEIEDQAKLADARIRAAFAAMFRRISG